MKIPPRSLFMASLFVVVNIVNPYVAEAEQTTVELGKADIVIQFGDSSMLVKYNEIVDSGSLKGDRVSYIQGYHQVGKRVHARWSNGFYYNCTVTNTTADSLRVRSDIGYDAEFMRSNWQAVVPDVTPSRTAVSRGSRVLAAESFTYPALRYTNGTVIDLNSTNPVDVRYKVRNELGEEDWVSIDQLRLLVPGFTESARDCLHVLHVGHKEDGVYHVNPDQTSFIPVFCDQKTNGGGWIVVQRRFDGSVDFYKDWNEYKEGFGEMTSEFWLGNDKLHRITTVQASQVLIELKGFDNQTAHASYRSFQVGSEDEKYLLHVEGYSGTAGDGMAEHNKMLFSTKDKDNDLHTGQVCAQFHQGAWWYKQCHHVNLNGPYHDQAEGIEQGKGVVWKQWRGYYHSLKETMIKVRPRRERDWIYELIFNGGPLDHVQLPQVTGLTSLTVCWWLKTTARNEMSAIFSLQSALHISALRFSYQGTENFTFVVNDEERSFAVKDNFMMDKQWCHMCITWTSSNGDWSFYISGIKRAEGSGLKTGYNITSGNIKLGGSFNGSVVEQRFHGVITRFNMWDEYIDDGAQIERIAHTCSSLTGNVVPWPEVQFWRMSSVEKNTSSLCRFLETYHWNFGNRVASTIIEDGLSAKRAHFGTTSWSTIDGLASLEGHNYLSVGDYKSECLSDPTLCNQGFTLNFWLRHKPHFISRILGFNADFDKILGDWFSEVHSEEGRWISCFKGVHGWTGEQFHTKCDGKGPTITLIRVQQNIFGGFLGENWAGGGGFIKDPRAFIFSLKNLEGLPPFKMNLQTGKKNEAAQYHSANGPIFGDGDIVIHTLPTTETRSYSNLGQTYTLPPNFTYSSTEAKNLLAGSEYFLVDDIEVFYFYGSAGAIGVNNPTKIPDSAMMAQFSYELEEWKDPALHNQGFSWYPYYKEIGEWLEVDLGSDKTVHGVAVQGDPRWFADKVTSYYIRIRASGSLEDSFVYDVTSDGSMDLFGATYSARYVRFTVQAWGSYPSMRAGVLADSCPSGWQYFQGSCYHVGSSSLNWEEAQDHCEASSANLVKIGDQAENDFVSDELLTDTSWLGLKENSPNTWEWVNDGTADPWVNKWKAGEPNHVSDQEDCGTLKTDGGWRLDDCNNTNQFVCEKVLPLYDVHQWSSSSWDCMTPPKLARLEKTGLCHASWCSKVNKWLEISLGRRVKVASVATQGALDDYGFVKSFKLKRLEDNGQWKHFRTEDGNHKVFLANWDGNTVVKQTLDPKTALALRFEPTECKTPQHCCMRVEIYETLQGNCPSSWKYFQGSCYLFTDTQSSSWSDAFYYCRSKAANLIKISSMEENDFVALTAGRPLWLALKRDGENLNLFKWNDGSFPVFTNWGPLEPSQIGEHCVHMLLNGYWNDLFCSALLGVACERESLDVIISSRGIAEPNPGILFGYQEFSNTYHVQVSTTNRNWQLRLPSMPLSWVHVAITWSEQWGLRFYRDGALVAEAASPSRLNPPYWYKYYNLYLGRSTKYVLSRSRNLQMYDLRIWDAVVPEKRMEQLNIETALPWYLWRNGGGIKNQWTIKGECEGSQQKYSCENRMLPRDAEYQYVGCFKLSAGPVMESLENTDPLLKTNYNNRPNHVYVPRCYNAARRKGHQTLFAFRNGKECLSASVAYGYQDVDKIYGSKVTCKSDSETIRLYVIKDRHNIAYKKPTSQSSVAGSKKSSFATDGSKLYETIEVCSLTNSQKNPWWQVDLGEPRKVSDVYIRNFPKQRRYLLEIRVGNNSDASLRENPLCGDSFVFNVEHRRRIRCSVPVLGRYVSITRLVDNGPLELCEVEVQDESTNSVHTDLYFPSIKGRLSILESRSVIGQFNCLSFQYLMFGESIGRLNVYIEAQDSTPLLAWRLAGNHGNTWKSAQFSIDAPMVYSVKFESVSGDGIIGEIDVRDITWKRSADCAFTPTQALASLKGFHSGIIGHVPSYQAQLEEWLSQAGFGGKYWVPCIRHLTDGWQSNTNFHSLCDNKGPTVSIIRKESYVFGGFSDRSWKKVAVARNYPSSKAFLFSLKPFDSNYGPTKLDVLPQERHRATVHQNSKGPCFSPDLCLNNLNAEANLGNVYNASAISDPGTFFAGEGSFQIDDVEVLYVGGSICDPPCLEGQTCDEVMGRCECDSTRRDVEWCWLRQEKQYFFDRLCNQQYLSQANATCWGRLFARYDVEPRLTVRTWKCYWENSLTGDRRRYDTAKESECYHPGCSPLGMENYIISDVQISGSSEFDTNHGTRNARLNFQSVGMRTGAWSTRVNDLNQWLQVDFGGNVWVSIVATQGRTDYAQWVKQYSLSSSPDGSAFDVYTQHGEIKVFDANIDRNTIVYNTLVPGIFTRYIRILPRAWQQWISMRAEFYDCQSGCSPLGMENDIISDVQISASSEFDTNHGTRNARLNFQSVGMRAGAWSTRVNDLNQWLQVDFGGNVWVSKVATQGRTDYAQWVTQYSLSSSPDGSAFDVYTQHGEIKVFDANVDRNTIVYNTLVPGIFTRYIRILPRAWQQWISMRAEFYNCQSALASDQVMDFDNLVLDAKHVWTFDGAGDIKDLQGASWAQGVALPSTTGVRGQAAKSTGGLGPIRLTRDHAHYLNSLRAVSLSVWLLYESKGVQQTFLASGKQEDGDRGIHLFQANGAEEVLTFEMTNEQEKCSLSFEVPQKVWTHLVFTATAQPGVEKFVVYLNEEILQDFSRRVCVPMSRVNPVGNDVTIGLSGSDLPLASFDDVMIWDRALSSQDIHNMFNYYKGSPNLRVKVSVELTSETFHQDLENWETQMYKNLTSRLKTQVESVYQGSSIPSVEDFAFKNVSKVLADFTVRFEGRGYKTIRPLDKSVTNSMLGTMPVNLIAIQANDVYMKQLLISITDATSSSLVVTWDDPGTLNHGIFSAVKIFYRLKGTPRPERNNTIALTGLLRYELKNLTAFSKYVISARPLTLEGEGRISEEVQANTLTGPPSSPPLNVKAEVISPTRINISWEPVPPEHHNGILLGYGVMYAAQTDQEQQQLNTTAAMTSLELQNLLKSTVYYINVTAYTSAGPGPLCPTLEIKTLEDVPSVAPIARARGTSFTSIMVTWTAIPQNRTHGVLRGYTVVYREVDSTNESEDLFACADSRDTEIRELKKSTTYVMRVAACTAVGCGNFSEPMMVTTDIDDCRPLGMENNTISDSQISASTELLPDYPARNARLNSQVAWASTYPSINEWLQVDFLQKVTVARVATQGDGNQVASWVSRYSLSHSQDGVGFEDFTHFGQIQVFEANFDADTVVYNTISPGITTQYVRVIPLVWHYWITMRVEFITCNYEIEPVNLTSSAPSTTSLGLSWAPVRGSVSGYRVEIIDLLREETVNHTMNWTVATLDLDSLKPYTPYDIKIFAFSSTWEGNITDTISVRTQEDAPSAPPRNVSVQNATVSGLLLQWEPVDPSFINGVLREYQLTYGESTAPNDTWKNVTIPVHEKRKRRSVESETVSFNLEGLNAFTVYSIIVLAVTIKDGVPTLVTNFTTAEGVPDIPPLNITAYNTSSTSVNVTWQPIPPDHVNGILQGYHVIYQRSDKVKDNVTIVTVNATKQHVELQGLGKYKDYVIRVAAFTVVGVGNISEAVAVRTAEDVPDVPPANIRARGTETTIIAVEWLPVPDENVNGIPLGYRLVVFDTSGINIRNYSLNLSVLSLEITSLEIWTNYSIQLTALTIKGNGTWSEKLLTATDEEAPYISPTNLTGTVTSSTTILVQWNPVVIPNLRGILRGYRVYYQEAPSSVHPSVLRNTSVDIRTTETELVNLHKFTEYEIWVAAFTTRDGSFNETIFELTFEDVPGMPPLHVTYSSPTSTSMRLVWGSVPAQFQNGIIAGYEISYRERDSYGPTVTERFDLEIHWVLITGLKKFTFYSVRVAAVTSIGIGEKFPLAVLTAQDVPSRAPQDIWAESHVTLTTIPVTWQPIDPQYLHGILLGYKIRYQAVAVGEKPVEEQPITEKTIFSPSTLSYLIENLEIFTVYRVDVVGFTIKGDGPAATDYAETCRCHKRLTTSWYEFRPYVNKSSGLIAGLIPPILSHLAVTCCQTCQSHGLSYVDYHSDGLGHSAEQPNLQTLWSNISDPTDFFFPIYGFKDQTHFANIFGYHGIVESPGMAYVVNTNSHDDMPNAVIRQIFSCWPGVMLVMAITYLAGLAVWSLESRTNPQDFPPSFIEGASEGFYWSFVSMTTVGYGDRAPITFAGRILTIFVILSGLVIFGIINSIMAASITSITMETDYKIYGAKVAAIAGSPEYRMGIRKNARMDKAREYHSFEDLYTALKERHVIGALIETYSAGSSKERFKNEHLRLNKILDFSSTYGVVMGKEARKLKCCFKDATAHAYASEISHHVEKNTEQLEEPPEPLSLERSTGLFDAQSAVFRNTLHITVGLFFLFLLLGTIYEIIRRCRSRAKVQHDDRRRELVADMKVVVEKFNERMRTLRENVLSRHRKERSQLLASFKQKPSRKYESTFVLTEELDNPVFRDESSDAFQEREQFASGHDKSSDAFQERDAEC